MLVLSVPLHSFRIVLTPCHPRHRQSSVELLGDLLFKVRKGRDACKLFMSSCSFALSTLHDLSSHHLSCNVPAVQVAGTSGKVHIDGDSDDEGASTEAHGAAITEALGWQRRNEVMCLHQNMHGLLST